MARVPTAHFNNHNRRLDPPWTPEGGEWELLARLLKGRSQGRPGAFSLWVIMVSESQNQDYGPMKFALSGMSMYLEDERA